MVLDVLLCCDNTDVLHGQRKGTSVTWIPVYGSRQICDKQVWGTLPLLSTGEWLGSLGSCLLTPTLKPEASSSPSDHGSVEPYGATCSAAVLSLKRTVVCRTTLPAKTTCVVTRGAVLDGMSVTFMQKNMFWLPHILLGNIKPLAVVKNCSLEVGKLTVKNTSSFH